MKTRTGYALMDAHISEMDSTPSDKFVPIDKELIERVKEGDDNPLFITMQVLAEGVSGNGKHYTPELLEEVAESVNSKHPLGYQGHLSKDELATKAPDPLVMWLGAKTHVNADGKKVLYARGYIMPDEKKFKTYLQKAKAAGKNVAMSIQGTAKRATYNAGLQAYDLAGFKLNSIDFSRDGAEGMKNTGSELILASEMVDEDNNNEGDKAVNKADVLKQTNISEMQEHNPELVSEIQAAATDETLVSEMQELKELSGDLSPKEYIAEMELETRQAVAKGLVASKVKARGARPLIEDMVLSEMEEDQEDTDVSEMVDSVLGSASAKAVLSQFTNTAPKVSKTNKKPEAIAEKRSHTKKTLR